ncbi:MAG: hypothetical protein KGP12_03955 [Actinomycetales bacterium]|nr:hypothetical protein [Actinomycetales bacterium]
MTERDDLDEALAVARQPDDTLADATVIVGRLPNGDLEVTDVGTGYDIAGITGKADPVRADGARMADADGYVDFGDGTRWALGGTKAAESMARESMAGDLIDQWAKTSNDASARSHAIQQAAREEFGLQDAAQWDTGGGWSPAVEEGQAMYARHGGVYRDFLAAQHAGTQQFLADRDVGSVVLWRGVKSGAHLPAATQVQARPLSSWAYQRSAAETFAGDQGIVMRAVVPAARILSQGTAGVGCLTESEMVILGGQLNVQSKGAGQWPDRT